MTDALGGPPECFAQAVEVNRHGHGSFDPDAAVPALSARRGG